MKFTKTKIKGVYLIELEPKADERGSFSRIFCKTEFANQGIEFDIVQANLSTTQYEGSIRGLHFQYPPKEEGKVVQCLKGRIYDVLVDLRSDSSTYGKWEAFELTNENRKLLFIPKGLAHGFQALTDNCEVLYFMSEFYSPEYAGGIFWNDAEVGIKWPLEVTYISNKDKNLPLFSEVHL